MNYALFYYRSSALDFLLKLSQYETLNIDLRDKVADTFVKVLPGIILPLSGIIQEDTTHHSVIVVRFWFWLYIYVCIMHTQIIGHSSLTSRAALLLVGVQVQRLDDASVTPKDMSKHLLICSLPNVAGDTFYYLHFETFLSRKSPSPLLTF